MLRWTKERDVLEKLTLGSMAKYTLAINSARNADLLANLKWAATQPQPDTVKPVLTEMIEAAETVETGKLRNEALAAIEELKRKGPGYKRDISLWGQVGEGALAHRLHRGGGRRASRIRHPVRGRRGRDPARIAAWDWRSNAKVRCRI